MNPGLLRRAACAGPAVEGGLLGGRVSCAAATPFTETPLRQKVLVDFIRAVQLPLVLARKQPIRHHVLGGLSESAAVFAKRARSPSATLRSCAIALV